MLPCQRVMDRNLDDKVVHEPDQITSQRLSREWREAKLVELNRGVITVRFPGKSSNIWGIDGKHTLL